MLVSILPCEGEEFSLKLAASPQLGYWQCVRIKKTRNRNRAKPSFVRAPYKRPLEQCTTNQPSFHNQTNLERINCDSRSKDAHPGLAVDHAVPKAELVAAGAPTGSADGSLPRHDGHDEEVGKQTYGSSCYQEHHENLF